jgi:hypothetical protein
MVCVQVALPRYNVHPSEASIALEMDGCRSGSVGGRFEQGTTDDTDNVADPVVGILCP